MKISHYPLTTAVVAFPVATDAQHLVGRPGIAGGMQQPQLIHPQRSPSRMGAIRCSSVSRMSMMRSIRAITFDSAIRSPRFDSEARPTGIMGYGASTEELSRSANSQTPTSEVPKGVDHTRTE